MQSFLNFSFFTVEHLSSPSNNIINIFPILTSLLLNSKSLFKPNTELTNVDVIYIQFHTDEDISYSYVNSLELKFPNSRDFFINSAHDGFIGEFSEYNNDDNHTIHTYTIIIYKKSYTTSSGISFKFETSNTSIKELTKNKIISTFHQIESEDDNAIQVIFSITVLMILYSASISDD